ncbi:alpha/beta fold hydrolase [Streptomyces sp. NBC_00704]|uniref:alpha/beta fold hydrolase n=1 Tax=Streptomyces sp. NBC_00704 TaxID=2975809 RepID=UPI002E2F03D3|nr:alpha/beta fold hydrolase [Streptomyces sp. NBC_00704]
MNAYDDEAFQAAYETVMARWPADREAVRVPTPYGAAYVNACGPRDAPPVLLLPGGGGATSASWYAQAAGLARVRRVYALDLVGAAGRSTGDGVRTLADLDAWLDAVLTGLGVDRADVGGHSYGGWLALRLALRAPERVRRLFLLDPTQCFAGFATTYLLRALPMLVRPTPRRVRAFLEWETGGAGLDPDCLRLQEAAAGFPARRPVTGSRPRPEALRGLDSPVLLLVAANSRTSARPRLLPSGADPFAYGPAARARAAVRDLETVVVPDVSHHALPSALPEDAARRVIAFLDG